MYICQQRSSTHIARAMDAGDVQWVPWRLLLRVHARWFKLNTEWLVVHKSWFALPLGLRWAAPLGKPQYP